MGSCVETAVHLASRLSKEIIDHPTAPEVDVCIDLLEELKEIKITMSLLEKSKLGKYLTKSVKAFKRHQRTESTSGGNTAEDWNRAIEISSKLLGEWKQTAEKEAKSKTAKKVQNAKLPGLPKNASEYRLRLVTQKKEMYKDPPVLPLPTVVIESEKCPLPKRNKSTGELSFVAGEDSSIKSLLKDFHPNRTPEGKETLFCWGRNVYGPTFIIIQSFSNLYCFIRCVACRIFRRYIFSVNRKRSDECPIQWTKRVERHGSKRMD